MGSSGIPSSLQALALIASHPEPVIVVKGVYVLPGRRTQRSVHHFFRKGPVCQGISLLFSTHVGSLHPALAREGNDVEKSVLLLPFTKDCYLLRWYRKTMSQPKVLPGSHSEVHVLCFFCRVHGVGLKLFHQDFIAVS